MPKVKYCEFVYRAPANVPPIDMVAATFRQYMKALHIDSEEMGERVGMKGQSVRAKLSKGSWTVKDIQKWCRALGITDPTVVGQMILYRG